MLRNKKRNAVDSFLNTVVKETMKANDKSEFLSNPNAIDLYQSMILNRFEIRQMTELFRKEFLPKSAKLFNEERKAWMKSSYRKLFKITDEQLKSNYYETVRLGYISIFHKYEGYVILIIPKFEKQFNDSWDIKNNLIKFVKKEFNFQLDRHWTLTPRLERINWIVNSCKHFNGNPRPKGHDRYPEFPKGEKLKLDKKSLLSDAKYIEELTDKFNQLTIKICAYKAHKELSSNQTDKIDKVIGGLANIEKAQIQIELLALKKEEYGA